ncbi:phosphoserine phosphatase SerB [Roseicyclus sp. F158]|uniref:Phosphoserine phosphatase n=1 Tax=Tropicimonas omnivorans TaxID=3075590 RepID=A0ABU3DC10_9RHOB|nr:phosphoserine phosphatase SerB [Roseicyclus sp. F158]MDT0681089.1 phosphoserine phosphatase SerB [Roseicyclus sp. F158]
MFVVTLLTSPKDPVLDPALVHSLRDAMGGGDAVWLAPDEAAEFRVPALPGNRWEIWDELQASGVDMCVQPGKGRRKRLLIADMDSTMIEQECIDELADMAGVGPHVSEITARAMNGELDFEGALRERVALLKNLPESVIGEVLDSRITLAPGGRTLVSTMKRDGAETLLVSGGFTAFTARIASLLGFDRNRANTLLAEDGRLTGEVAEPILGRQAKVDALTEVTAELGLTPGDAIAVGDGANDLGMLHLAGSGVALHAKPAVAAECELRINHGDLTALLYLQGYAKAEFA